MDANEQLGLLAEDLASTQPEVKQAEPEAEGETQPAEGQGQEQGEQPQTEKPYSDEEVVKILESDGKLDSRRLTPTQKLVQQSFAKHANKGFQEIAQMKRDMQSQLEQVRQNAAPPRSIEEAYARDPRGVLNFIDQQIESQKLEADKDPFNAIKQLAHLQAWRNRLTDMGVQAIETRRQFNEVTTSTLQEVAEAIPDFGPEKQKALTEFAVQELGYTMEDLSQLTDPRRGRLAAQVVKTINAAYDTKYGSKEKAAISASQKKVNRMPVVEGAARSQTSSVPNQALSKAMSEAKKTGDWTKVLDMKGVIDRIVP